MSKRIHISNNGFRQVLTPTSSIESIDCTWSIGIIHNTDWFVEFYSCVIYSNFSKHFNTSVIRHKRNCKIVSCSFKITNYVIISNWLERIKSSYKLCRSIISNRYYLIFESSNSKFKYSIDFRINRKIGYGSPPLVSRYISI